MPLVTVAAPIKQPRMRFFDAEGKPLVGGRVYSYKVGTDLFRPTFRNAYKTALNQNPIILDNAGSALIYLIGSHLLQVFDRFGNFVSMHYLPVTEMRAYFHDKLGKPLKYGRIETYDIASTIKKASYGDSQKESLNTNPVILDKNGSAVICIVGSYRLRVYDEKGVFLWDEDFFREPARVLTSKVYPIYLDEDIASNFAVLSAKYSGADTQEQIGTEFMVLSPVRIDSIIYSDYFMEPESILTEFEALNPVRTDSVIYSKYNLDPEKLTTVFGVNSPIRQVVLLRYDMDPESISTQFSVLNPVRK